MDTTVAPEHLCVFMRLNAGCSLLAGHQGKKDSSGLEENVARTSRRKRALEILRCLSEAISDCQERVSKNFRVTEVEVRHFLHSRDLFRAFLDPAKNAHSSRERTETCEESSIVLRLIS